jgi:enamine deaminase RidA (YjgF/YER057c/UK114 family)
VQKEALRPRDFPFFDYSRYSFSLGVQVGDRVWLSGHSASRYDPAIGTIVVTGTMREQAAVSHAKQAAILAAAGMDFGNVVRVVDYITPRGRDAYTELIEERARIYGGHPPATSAMVVDSLLRPDALIETEVTATREPAVRYGVSAGLGGVPRAAAVQVGPLLYTSAVLPLDENGRLVEGGLLEQTEQCFKNAERVLAAAGYSMSEVVKTIDYSHPSVRAEYGRTGRIRAAYLGEPGSVYLGATGILMSELVVPGALIQIEFTACHGEKQPFNPGWDRYQKLTYYPATRVGDYLFLSGQAALNPETNQIEHPGDIVAQARYTYANIRKTMEAAGLTMDHIVKTVEYVTPAGLADYRKTAAIRKEFFNEPFPAATGIVCAALLRPEMLIEVDCWALATP